MCPKITVVLSEETENELRDYIRRNYRKPFGKLSEIIDKSVQEYLEREHQKTSE